jgi:inner membrane protein
MRLYHFRPVPRSVQILHGRVCSDVAGLLLSRAMPSPVGHALAGLAVGVLVAGPRSLVRAIDPPAARRPIDTAMLAVLPFAALGALPDVDLLFGIHSMYTHSIGAAAVVLLLARVVTGSWRWALGASLAYASHILLDWMGNDTTPPIGIMALWPFTSNFYESDLHLFLPISRRYWLPGFIQHNFTALVRELLVIGPLAMLAFWRLERVAHYRH